VSGAQRTEPTTQTSGHLIRTPRRYDLGLWYRSWGREGRFRDEQIRLARLRPGDRVLDLGCGTGSLSIAAARVVGPTGAVTGIDPSLEMVARARSKAHRAHVDATFVATAGEALPFPGAAFDVVLISLVLHQLPSDALHGAMFQVRRVLKPGGRLFVVDLGTPEPGKRTVHSHAAHASARTPFTLEGLEMFFDHLGLPVVERGDVAFRFRGLEPLRYVLAEAPSA
jgi:ubiquinone/menaquinone biosynthesis C-methylase UbiE